MLTDPKELIRAGRLTEARQNLIEGVKASPADVSKRTLLFQVQALLGEWEKAERSLDLIAAQNQKSETGVQVYKNILQAEKARADSLKLKARPSFIPKTPVYSEKYFLACEKLSQQKPDEALQLFEEIEESRPGIAGTINGKPFTGFRDIDTRLSFFLEAFTHDKYLLIPVEELREVMILPPQALFDLVWVTAQITTWDGLSMQCYIPVLYSDSYLHADDRVKLGRMTEWIPAGGVFVKGAGQRMFEAGDEDISLLEIKQLNFTWTADRGEDEKTA